MTPIAIPSSPGNAEKAIAWLSVVDDFRVRKHRNIFPRWTMLFAILAIVAI
jgi:hypothetical protein